MTAERLAEPMPKAMNRMPMDTANDIPATPKAFSETGMLLPYSIPAEQAVLGGILLDNNAFFNICSSLSASDFYDTPNQIIFNAIKRLIENNKTADYLTVADELTRAGRMQEITEGAAYLISLVQNTPSSRNVAHYADIVRGYSVRRQLIVLGNSLSGMGFDPEGKDTAELLDFAEKKIFDIAEQSNRGKDGIRQLGQVFDELIQLTEKRYEEGVTGLIGVPSGFCDLDKITAGFQNGDLIIVAGRPSMGKTAFALNVAEHVAVNEKLPVLFFSMEMSAIQLTTRVTSSISKVAQQKLRTGDLNDTEWELFINTLTKTGNTRFFIDETSQQTPLEIRGKARRIARAVGGKLGLIVVDYMQLMTMGAGQRNRNENRTTEMSDISRSLKALAKELNTPVIALSQLSRAVEARSDKRPLISDLRESGAIEQDADLILMLYREEYYKKTTENAGRAEVIIGKHRNGQTGLVHLAFKGECTRFNNLSNYNIGVI